MIKMHKLDGRKKVKFNRMDCSVTIYEECTSVACAMESNEINS